MESTILYPKEDLKVIWQTAPTLVRKRSKIKLLNGADTFPIQDSLNVMDRIQKKYFTEIDTWFRKGVYNGKQKMVMQPKSNIRSYYLLPKVRNYVMGYYVKL